MKRTICILLLLLPLNTAAQPSGSNEVYGEIVMPPARPFLVRGELYNKDGSRAMHSDDPMARPERNVIVSAHPLNFQPALPPTSGAYITQKEQTFLPAVLPVTRGSTVHFLNEDQFFHSIYSLTLRHIAIGRRPPGESHPRKIDKAGVIKLSCDIHTHMRGVILSLETPYFTRAEENGRYRLSGLPDGQYRLEVFHIDRGNRAQTISLSGGKALARHFNLNQP